MLSPSDFNSAVPQFTNGNYASNPVNPQYIAEPSSTDYNRGAEPLQTLPAQWWNWFLNKFTSRFNKLNVYVKNIFNELSQLLSLAEMTPDGTEGTPTVEQLKTMFACCYPSYVKETAGLVPNTTTVNGHALTGNISVTRSDLGLGTSATVNTGSGAGCIPTVGTALGSTANKIVLTTSSGTLQPSSNTVGSAAYCDASCFRASTWTPSCVACAGANGSGVAFGSAATCDASCFRASTWTPSCATCATKISRTGYTSAYSFDVLLTNGSTTADGTVAYVSNQCRLLFCNTTGVLTAKCFCGSLSGTATNANNICTTMVTANIDRNLLLGEVTYTSTGCAGVYIGNSCKATFNTANGVLKAKCFCGCAQDSGCLTGKTPAQLNVGCADSAICATNAYIHQPLYFSIIKLCYSSLLCGESYCKPLLSQNAYFKVCFTRPVILYNTNTCTLDYIPAGGEISVCGSCTCSCASLCTCWQTTYNGYYRFW